MSFVTSQLGVRRLFFEFCHWFFDVALITIQYVDTSTSAPNPAADDELIAPVLVRARLCTLRQAQRGWIHCERAPFVTIGRERYYSPESLDEHCLRWEDVRRQWPRDWPPCTFRTLRRLGVDKLGKAELSAKVRELMDWFSSPARVAAAVAPFEEFGLAPPHAKVRYVAVYGEDSIVDFCRRNRPEVENWVRDRKKWETIAGRVDAARKPWDPPSPTEEPYFGFWTLVQK